MTTLPMGPLMAARARAKGGDVDVRRVGAATVLLFPSPASELDDRTFDVDPRAADDIGEILELVRRAGRRPLLEIDQLLMGDEERDSLAARGLVRRWNVAELRKDLSTGELSSAKSITVRDVRADEAEAFGALAEAAFGEPPPGLPPIVPGELRAAWSAYRSVGIAQCYFAESDGVPCAVALSIRVGDVSMVDGAATLPAFRGRGAQLALLAHRFRAAREAGCRLAVTRTAESSPSQRNLVRAGMELSRVTEVWGQR